MPLARKMTRPLQSLFKRPAEVAFRIIADATFGLDSTSNYANQKLGTTTSLNHPVQFPNVSRLYDRLCHHSQNPLEVSI